MIDGIMVKWRDAIAEEEELDKVRTLHIRGRISALGLEGPMEQWATSDGDFRYSLDLGGVYSLLRVFNAKSNKTWQVDNNGNLEELDGTDAADHRTEAFLYSFSHLVQGRLPGALSHVESNSGEHVVEIAPSSGTPVRFHVDAATGLPLRCQQALGDLTRTTVFEEWKTFDGLRIPSLTRETTGVKEMESDVVVEDVDINADIDPAMFEKPIVEQETPFVDGDVAVMPVRLNGAHILVEATANGMPVTLLIDTGAQMSGLDTSVLERLGVATEGSIAGGGAGEGVNSASLASGITFELPGVKLRDQTVVVLSIGDLLTRFTGSPIGGVLGHNFFSRFAVEIDYAGRQMRLMAPNHKSAPSDTTIDVSIESGIPMLQATIVLPDGRSLDGNFVVDTGAADSLYLTTPFVEQHDLLDVFADGVELPVPGVGGESRLRVGRVQSFRIAGEIFDAPTVYLSRDRAGAFANPGFAGIVGGEFLRRFTVTFDYAARKMTLVPNAARHEAFPFDCTGLTATAEGDSLDRFVVHALVAGGPAEVAGVQVGDRFVTINGRDTTAFSLSDVYNELRRPGELPLCIERGQDTIELVVSRASLA